MGLDCVPSSALVVQLADRLGGPTIPITHNNPQVPFGHHRTMPTTLAGGDDTEILYHVDGKIPTVSAQLLAAQKSYGHMYTTRILR